MQFGIVRAEDNGWVKDEYLIDYLEHLPNDKLKKILQYHSNVDGQKTQRFMGLNEKEASICVAQR